MQILGRTDRVDLPGLGLYNIQAKVDTGAYTSCLHCSRAEVIDGQLEFVLLDDEHPEFTGLKFVFTEYDEREIKNSFGVAEKRYVISTTVKIFDEEIMAEFSLGDRDAMRFPILLGRKILRDRFLIDVTKKNLSYRANKASRKRKKRTS
ncbi:MAG: RimK/LysX family protein [Cyclobacteriaceae bacterium]